MTEINKKYTKYIDYLNNDETIFRKNEIRDCLVFDISIIGFEYSYYNQFKEGYNIQFLDRQFDDSFNKVAKMIFKDFNITLYDLYKEFKNTLPNFIYYLKIRNLNTIDDLRNRIMKIIDDYMVYEEKNANYFKQFNNYLKFLLSIPEDFDFSNIIKEMIEDKFISSRIYHTKDKRLLVNDLLIPNLRSIMIYMLTENDYIDIAMNCEYADYGVSTPMYIKYDLLNEILTFYGELYNYVDEDDILVCYFGDNCDVIDFFIKRLDKYMTN